MSKRATPAAQGRARSGGVETQRHRQREDQLEARAAACSKLGLGRRASRGAREETAHILDAVGALDLQRDGLPREGLDEDLRRGQGLTRVRG